jgi:hypothetical protein
MWFVKVGVVVPLRPDANEVLIIITCGHLC